MFHQSHFNIPPLSLDFGMEDDDFSASPFSEKTPHDLVTPMAPYLAPLPPPPSSFFALSLAPVTRGVHQNQPQHYHQSQQYDLSQSMDLSVDGAQFDTDAQFDPDLVDLSTFIVPPSQFQLEPDSDVDLWACWDSAWDQQQQQCNHEHASQQSQYQTYQMRDFCEQKNALQPQLFHKVQFATHTEQEGCCSICIDTIHEQSKIATLPCGHKFHANCIKRCCKFSTRCPNCRHELDDTRHIPIASSTFPNGGILFL